MPHLPESLKRPQPYLLGLLLLIALVVADGFRPPGAQASGKAYASAVSAYQWTKSKCGVQGVCRFSPSCSRFSSEAVAKHGLWKGLRLTHDRLRRCRTSVPMGTKDPVPLPAGP